MNLNRFKNFYKYIPTLILIIILINIIRSIDDIEKARNRIVSLEDEIDVKLQENRELQEKLKYVKSEEFTEKMALERLNLVRPNEKILIIPTKPVENAESIEILSDNSNSKNIIWQKWLKVFKLENLFIKLHLI